jgi:hypothetical protein
MPIIPATLKAEVRGWWPWEKWETLFENKLKQNEQRGERSGGVLCVRP